MRIVRALSAIARVTACRIHHVAYVERPLLDQVEEGQSAAQVALRDRDDEPQVRLDHLRLGAHVAALDPLGQVDLLVGGQQRHLPDLAQVEPQRVERRLDRQVELRRNLRLLLGRRLLVWRVLVMFPLDQLDAVVDEVGVEVFDLLLGELDVLEPGDDLVVGEKTLVLALLDELL
jgi:hypothetical protein